MKPGPGFYLGAGMGQGGLRLQLDGVSGHLQTHDLSFKGFAGWRFNQYLSIEGTYADLGAQKKSEDGLSLKVEPKWVSASAIGTWPLKDNFAVYGRLGMGRWSAHLRAEDDTDIFTGSDHGTEFTYGVGLSSYLDGAIVRLEYERLDNAESWLFRRE